MAKQALRAKGFDGQGEFQFESPFEVTPSFRLTGRFETNPRPDILAGESFRMPVGLVLGERPGDALMGSLSALDVPFDEPTPCFSGKETEELSLALPEGRQLRELPKGTEIHNRYLMFKSEWRAANGVVTVRREFSSSIDAPVCLGDARALAATALDEIRRDYNTTIALATR